MKLTDLQDLLGQSEFSAINRQFADFMLKLSGSSSPLFYLACGLLSHRAEQGDVCLDLLSCMDDATREIPGKEKAGIQPTAEMWLQELQGNPVVGQPGEKKPLILDSGLEQPKLYLYRSWTYEKRLADYIRKARMGRVSGLDNDILADGLKRLFPGSEIAPDEQAEAAAAAMEYRFCVITGGPGTGKTTTVFRIILLLLEQSVDAPCRFALAAPTGKAANRLRESIRASLEKARDEGLVCEPILSRVPVETVTIHRLLGNITNSPRFRHDNDNPLPYDCVIVDEASMVDLALMSKLVSSLRPDCRLILLGDRNQLSSVEAGSVLADICSVSTVSAPEADGIISLQKSYRFDEDSAIGRLSRYINDGDADATLESIRLTSDEISRVDTPTPGHLVGSLAEKLLEMYRMRLKIRDPDAAFREISRFCIVSALRNGLYGSLYLNRAIERILREERIITGNDAWYAGRPVMITRNDYQLELYNGDIGIVMPERENSDRMKVWFETGPGQYRPVSPSRLPEHETAFAITIHKSQGSEFDRVLMILPDHDAPVVTRELIYTGITRARRSVDIWGKEEILAKAIRRRTERSSGLAGALLD